MGRLLDNIYSGYSNSPETVGFLSGIEDVFNELRNNLIIMRKDMFLETVSNSAISKWGRLYNALPTVQGIEFIINAEIPTSEFIRKLIAFHTDCEPKDISILNNLEDGILFITIPEVVTTTSLYLESELDRILPAHINKRINYLGITYTHKYYSQYTHQNLHNYRYNELIGGNL
ncbi:MAG: hypothetical protein RR389_01100 [Christensenella sp.]